VSDPPDDDDRKSPMRLALYGLVVGLVALTAGRLASAAVGTAGPATRTTVLVTVSIGITLLAAWLSDPVLHRLRRRRRRRPL
jgi:hypothetical protein